MEKLTLKNGSEFEGYALTSSGYLFIYVTGSDMKSVFNAFVEPENTEEIIYTDVNDEQVTFTGFTKLISVRDEGNSLITATMGVQLNV